MRSLPLTVALCLCCCAIAECQRRRIEGLPRLLFRPNFTQYSGYLTSSVSTGNRRLFYWLVESSHVPASTAPLVLWMNGGPGCSSVGGLLMTNGPFLANDRAELDRNEFAWNRLANVLYIDSPSGVGLSEPGPIDPSVLNDRVTAQLNLGALLNFFSLFPEYRGRPFYIAGESYAGIYIPLLASAIIDGGHRPHLINLTGIAVGNGLHVPYNDSNFDASRRALTDAMGATIGLTNAVEVSRENKTFKLNEYNVAQPCYPDGYIDGYHCLNSTGLISFLNDKEAQVALGVSEVALKYRVCQSNYRSYSFAKKDVLEDFERLAKHNVPVLLYQGTLDVLLPEGITRKLLDRLPLDPPATGGQDVWFYCLGKPGFGLQIGGVQRSYMGGRIRYRTVVGAGHSVVTDRPEIGLQILEDFLAPEVKGTALPSCSSKLGFSHAESNSGLKSVSGFAALLCFALFTAIIGNAD